MISSYNGSTEKLFISIWSASGGLYSSTNKSQFVKELKFGSASTSTFIYKDPNDSKLFLHRLHL